MPDTIVNNDEYWMRRALEQAAVASSRGEVPVGAVLVDSDNQLLAESHNQPISQSDPSAHAEVMVLREAAKQLDNYRLVDTTLYVTLEPCVMCVGALIHARVKRLVYGAREHKTGAIVSLCRLLNDTTFNHQIEVDSGVLEAECAQIMSSFFAQRRAQKKQLKNGEKNE